MLGALLFASADQVCPCYVIDSNGSLVRCSMQSHRHGELIPGASLVVSTATELASPLAWTITTEMVETRLAGLVDLMPVLREAYPELKVPTSPFPFAPKIDCPDSDEMVVAALDMVAKHGEVETAPVIEYLNQVGIFKIPTSNTFNAAIHEAAEGVILGERVEVLADGWYSHMKVFRKAVVR
jgi:hypothetical protein